MPTVIGTVSPITGDISDKGILVVWAQLANGENGDPLPFVDCADRTVQVEGTFGVGGTLVIEGSNDGSNYRILHDPQGVALSIVGPQISVVTQVTKWIRPRVSGGDVSTLLTVSIVARRTNK